MSDDNERPFGPEYQQRQETRIKQEKILAGGLVVTAAAAVGTIGTLVYRGITGKDKTSPDSSHTVQIDQHSNHTDAAISSKAKDKEKSR